MASPPAINPPKIIPPHYFLASLIAMGLLAWRLPMGIILPWPWSLVGVAPVIAGIGLAGWAAGLFKRADTNIHPLTESSALVTTGPYRVSRNPMYLGLTLVLVGVATVSGAVSPWLVVPVFVAIIQLRFIRCEEAMLHARFGDDYNALCTRVRRWI